MTFDALRADLRSTFRGLRNSPLYGLAAISSLALAIGATIAAFLLVERLVLQRAPWSQPQEIALLRRVDRKTGEASASWSQPRFEDVRRAAAGSGIDVTSFATRGVTLAAPAGDSGIRADAEFVAPGYLRLTGVAPAGGRVFDGTPSADPSTVILSSRMARRLFPQDDAIGKTLRVNGVVLTVIGTMPDGFHGLSGRAELWAPLAAAPAVWAQPEALSQYYWAFAIALRVPTAWTGGQRRGFVDNLDRALGMNGEMVATGGATTDRASASSQLELISASDALKEPGLTSLLWILLAAAICVLVLACANVASLSVARLTARRMELAVRSALGATSARLATAIVNEAAVIALSGTVIGFAAAVVGKNALWNLRPRSGSAAALLLGNAAAPTIGARTIGFAIVVSVAAICLIALWPVTEVRRPLGERRGAFGMGSLSSTADPRTSYLRAALSTLQIAVAFVVTMSAVLFIVSLRTMTQVNHGFVGEKVLTMRLDLPGTRYDAVRARELYSEFLTRVARIPGVVAADITNTVPLDGSVDGTAAVIALDLPNGKGGRGTGLEYHIVGPSFFRTLGVDATSAFDSPVARGGAVPVIITRSAATRFWPGRNPIGQPIHDLLLAGMNGEWKRAEVVGIASDVQYGIPGTPAEPGVYVSSLNDTPARAALLVRAQGNPLQLVGSIRAALRSIDPQLVLFATKTMDERGREVSAATRFGSIVLAAYAGAALVIALIGVYSVIAFGVAQRRVEIGIRMALGAAPRVVLEAVLRRGLVMTALGLAAGLAAILGVQRVIARHLFGVAATDPRWLGVVMCLFAAAGLCASLIPAVNATRVDPASALRNQG